ncbi:hypothetical protein AGDE_15923 [Angomonas deanei]|nr:hypothetical protein AGDE_15923 [Angomonas deanei]|eukprot:EPY18139.1 hypothetical protein AGDE_15923 [Angomonas deanei]
MVVLHATNPCVISTLKPLMDGDTEAAKSTPRFLSPTDPGHEHRIPTTEKPVMRLHHSKQDIAEIAAMAGGDVSYITTFQEEEKKHEKKVSSSSSSDFFASSESSVSSDEEDEEGAEEVLCPVPGLDDINYGRFSGHSIQWIKRRYARLSPLLYGEDCVNNSSTTTGTETTDDPPTVIPPPRTEKLKEAVKWLQHHPTDKDLRLSYCVQFPNGESCRQVNVRLEPAMMAVMRTQSPVFVVAPHVPAQGMLAFFADVIPELSPTLRVPYGCVVEIGIKEDVTIHPLIPVRHDFLPEVGSPLIDMEEVEEALGEIKRVNGAEEQKEAK